MANAWLDHVKKFWAKNKGKMSYSQALKEAKKSYHPTAKKGKQTKKDKKDESKGMKGKTKGSKSKSRKGDKDFTTKKGDKDFHEGGKDVKKTRKPYKKRGAKHGTK